MGTGPAILVIPGVLSMASDYAAFARALSEHLTVHTIERRGRGESGPQVQVLLIRFYGSVSTTPASRFSAGRSRCLRVIANELFRVAYLGTQQNC